MASIGGFSISVTANTAALNTGFKKTSKLTRGLTGSIGRLSSGIAAIGAPVTLIAGMASVIRTGAAFEKQMSNVQAFVGGTADQTQKLAMQAKELGKSTAFTASDAAAAMVELSKAGFDAEEVYRAVPGVLSLAAAGGIEMGEAATIAASAIRQFGLGADEMDHVADVIAAAAQSGPTDIATLGNQFTFASAAAQLAGMSFEETAAGLAVLSNSVGADKAGRSLSAVSGTMLQTTDDAKKAMDSLGLSFSSGGDTFAELPVLVDDFNQATAGLSETARGNFMARIFNEQAIRGFAGLMKQSGDELKRVIDFVSSQDGLADKIANQKLDNVAGEFERVKSAAEGLQITLFETFGDKLQISLQWVTDFLNNDVTSAFQSVNEMVEGFAQLWVDFEKAPLKALEALRNGAMSLFDEEEPLGTPVVEVLEHITERNDSNPALRSEDLRKLAGKVFGEATFAYSDGIRNAAGDAKEVIEAAKPAIEGLQIMDMEPPTVPAPPEQDSDAEIPVDSSPLGVALKGSSEAFDVINKAIKGEKDAHQKTIAKESEKQTKLLQQTVDLIDGIPDAMNNPEVFSFA